MRKYVSFNKKSSLLLISILVLISFLFSSCKLYTVVKHDKNSSENKGTTFYFDSNDFDADKYVESIWDSKVLPTMEKKANDAAVVLPEIKNNVDEAGKKYGIRSSDTGSAWNFIVKGKAKIVSVNTESKNGTMDMDLEPYDGNSDFKLQIGPVIKGTSIRDSLDFIKFDDFKNQMVFADLSNAMHKRLNEQILSKMDFKNAGSKEVEFLGAFTILPSGEILVTPVKIGLLEGGQ
jgi:predicted lipoprotein